jgi:hypothetical protein
MANGRIGSAWDLSVPSSAAHRTALAESTSALVRHDAARWHVQPRDDELMTDAQMYDMQRNHKLLTE